MIQPQNLMRSNSESFEDFIGPQNVTTEDYESSSCGWKKLNCLNDKFQKFATIKSFCFFYYILVFLQGTTSSYFSGTAHIWNVLYDFPDSSITDWIHYADEIFIGFLGILVSYYGNLIHRASWIGGLTLFQIAAGWTLLVPEMYYPNSDQVNVTEIGEHVCFNNSLINYSSGKSAIAASLLVIYQFFSAMSFISLFCHGLTYIDDHTQAKDRAWFVCLFFTVHKFGNYLGMYVTVFPLIADSFVFISPGWIVLQSLVTIFALFVTMFPKWLPSRINERLQIEERLLNIIDRDSNSESEGYSMFKRIFFNKLLNLNVLTVTLLTIGLTNFDILRKDFYLSSFVDLPKLITRNDDFINMQHYLSHVMEPVTNIAITVTSIIINKRHPHIRKLFFYVILVYILVALAFSSMVFINCEDHIATGKTFYCNEDCNCSLDTFRPVCDVNRNVTFFSPCHAGCKSRIKSEYFDCSCGTEVVTGTCSATSCYVMWLLAQINGMFVRAYITTAVIIHVLLGLSIVKEKDKSISLGYFLTFTKILPYIPFKILYGLIRDALCEIKHENGKCIKPKEMFPILLSLVTMSFIILAMLSAIWQYFHLKDLDIYEDRPSRRGSFANSDQEMQPYVQSNKIDEPEQRSSSDLEATEENSEMSETRENETVV